MPAHFLKELESVGELSTMRIKNAFLSVRREDFVPPQLRSDASLNVALPLPWGGFVSQPYIFAFMLERAYLQKGNRTLICDNGSGWEANVVAYLVDPREETRERIREPNVFALLDSDECAVRASAASLPHRFERNGVLRIIRREDEALAAPVHRIISFKHVDPSALEAWKERLAIGGRIVLPRRESVYVFEKTGNGEFMEKSFFGFHFPQN